MIVQSTKTFRVFVSSTFSDMKEERNALQKEVFPKLRKLCMEHGFRFQAIDLRWGVSEEAGLDQQTMKICLEEIERSQRVSPKPNFIVLLGDRYGWRPLPYEIPADEFEEIKSVIKDAYDRKFLFWEGDVLTDDLLKKREGWYCLDENAVPPVYCLKPRLVDYDEDASDDEIKEARNLEYKDWEDVEKRLKSILLNAIDELGWDKDDSRRFKYESSATEQEIIKGVLNLPEDSSLSEEHVFSFIRKIKGKKSIPFDDNSKDFFDFTASGTIDASAEEKLIALKDKIEKKLSKSNRFDYETEWKGKSVSSDHIKKLCDNVYSSLEKVINKQINEFKEKNPLDIEIEAHKNFGKERCKFFKGREDNRAQIENYLENPNSKPLIVYGESGSGKSALMAQSLEGLHPNFYNTPVDNVIVRFIGATPESSDMRSLLESLSRQITRIYGEDDSNIPTEYNDLVQDFKERLNFVKSENPLFIFLDALDQLSDSDNAHNLSWIPEELPENVHIVISTLKNMFQSSLEHRYSENTVEVLPLEKNDGRNILEAWFSDNKRKLTDVQETEVISKFEVEGLPLYLKLAFEESKLWKSYTPIPKLESDIRWMITNLFERLSRPENHGEILVSHSLGYLSAAKNGLTEDEMLDILALDEKVFSLTKKFHNPQEEKLPVALWSRLYFDLEPYLTERSADSTSLLAFYHRQLGEVAQAAYLKQVEKRIRHKILAKYFLKQDLYFDKKDEKVYNIRKVSELPYQETFGEMWDKLEETLTDLHFVEAKCAVNKTYELIRDYNLALDILPEAQEEKQIKIEHEKQINKYTKDLIAYAKGEIQTLKIIPSVKPWSQEQIKKDTERIINNPTRLDHIRVFSQFVNSQSHALAEFGHRPDFCLQQAYNSANSGSIAETARKIIKKEIQNPLYLKDENFLPKYNPHPSVLKIMEGHTGWVLAVAVTPDGKTAITGSWDHTVRVWDLETGENKKTLEGHKGRVAAVAVTPDGKTAITGSWDHTVRVWDLETGENKKTLEGHIDLVFTVAVTADGKTLISGSKDNTVMVWDVETGEKKKTLEGHSFGVGGAAVTADGKTLITGSIDYTVRVWDLETGENQKILQGHTREVVAVAVTADGKTLITGSWDMTVRVWDLETGENQKILRGHTEKVHAVAVTADGKTLISGSKDNTIRVWDLETDDNQKILFGHGDSVFTVAVTADGKTLISGSKDHTIRVWDLETGDNQKILRGHTSRVVDVVVVTVDGKTLITGSYDRTVRVWDLETGENIKTLEGHKGCVDAVAVTPDGKTLITGSDDSTVRVWDLETGDNQKILLRHGDSVFTVAVTPDGKILITGSIFGSVRVWDLETGENIKTLEGHKNSIHAVAVTPDGKTAITGSWDSVRVLDLETGENIKTLDCYLLGVGGVAVTPDGKTLITGSTNTNMSNDSTVRVWDLETGENIKTLEGHNGGVYAVAVTPDGKTLITGSIDSTVRVWDLETGENIKTLEGHNGEVHLVAVTPDGKTIITGSIDSTVIVWDLETGRIISVSKEEAYVVSLAIKSDVNFVYGCSDGDVIYSHLVNVPVEFPLITARRIWLYGGKGNIGFWDDDINADCPWCGNRFKVANDFLNTIMEIENQYKKSNGWISDEAWEDPRLISECPKCHKKLKFNPFIVDNSRDELNNDGNIQKGSEAPDEDLNESEPIIHDEKIIQEKKKTKKSRWKFWK